MFLLKILLQDYHPSAQYNDLVLRSEPISKPSYWLSHTKAMEEKWQELSQGKHLKYRGIHSIGYDHANGSEGVLKLSLHFTGDAGMEYYMALQKEENGKFRVWDFWGKPVAAYSSQTKAADERPSNVAETLTTTGSLISKEGGGSFRKGRRVFKERRGSPSKRHGNGLFPDGSSHARGGI